MVLNRQDGTIEHKMFRDVLDYFDDGDAMTITAAHAANICLQKSGFAAAIRPPDVSDAATDAVIITDPVTGLSLRLAEYGGYHLNQYEVSAVWGSAPRRRNLIKKLLG